MKACLAVMLLFPWTLLAQSPFDGTWVCKPGTIQFSKRPAVYSLRDGMYECESCVPKIKIKADGQEYPVAGSPYFSTVAVRVVDGNTVEIKERQGERLVYSETDTASGDTLTQQISDSAAPSGEPVTAEETYRKLSSGPAGSSAISGSWQPESLKHISENGITVTYQSMADGMKVTNPAGEGYTAKFDGKEYPVDGAPAHNTVSLKRVNDHTIEETDILSGNPHYRLRLTVLQDGKTMRIVENDMERGTRTVYMMEKKTP